jgi:hypothetical protein
LHGDVAAEKLGIRGHPSEFGRGSPEGQ